MSDQPASAGDLRPSERARILETRSIDYIPRAERHGKVWHQGPFWFTSNFGLLTLAAGFIDPALGLGLGWSLLAIVLGSMVGTFFMAFHANQGPTLGLPQMIQSRAQFGVRGAIIPFAGALFVYIGLNVFDTLVATDAFIAVGAPNAPLAWFVAIVVIQALIAIVGHDMLHFVQRWLTWALIPVFGLITVGGLVVYGDSTILTMGHFDLTAFLTVFGVVTGFLLGYAVYVSDYTRYMPSDTPRGPIVFWTYLGAAGSSIWMIGLGAFLASAITGGAEINSVMTVGNAIIPGLGTIALFLGAVGLVTVMAVNTYGATLVGISALDGFRRVRPTKRVRIFGVVIISAVILGIAVLLPEDFLDGFDTFLTMILYFLVPWTAINLADYYFVRKGQYAILDIFSPKGIYGRWSWRGLIAYGAGFLAMIPFFSLPVFTGFVAEALGGADISAVIGLPVAGLVYLALSRNIDRDAEAEAVRQSQAILEPGASTQGSTHAG